MSEIRRDAKHRMSSSSARHEERKERVKWLARKVEGESVNVFLLVSLQGSYVWRCVSAVFPLRLFSVVQENATKAHLTLMTLMKGECTGLWPKQLSVWTRYMKQLPRKVSKMRNSTNNVFVSQPLRGRLGLNSAKEDHYFDTKLFHSLL